jgi:hypothetical protein
MALEKSTLSRSSGRLVERGWVEIREHPDGRGVLLALTARGDQMLLQALPAWKQAQEQAQSMVAEALFDLEAGREPPPCCPRDRRLKRPGAGCYDKSGSWSGMIRILPGGPAWRAW